MAAITIPGDWTEKYAGSKLNLSGYNLSFSDEFNKMDVVPNKGTGKWFAPVHAPAGASTYMPPVGATNPFSVSDGKLTISMKQVDGAWQSGTMQTVNSAGEGFAQEYGYFEMRAAFHGGVGAWPAFWMLPQDTNVMRPEVDIVEAYGGDPTGHHQSVHLSDKDGQRHGHAYKSNYTGLPESLFDGAFHTYGAKITPDWIVMYYDGQELSRFPMSDGFRTPLYMLVTLSMYDSGVKQASGKYDMVVDYVRAYAAPGGTGGHQNGTAPNTSPPEIGRHLNGTAANDILNGGKFDDVLDGRAGADKMSGGLGNDTYKVDNASDVVVEGHAAGNDRVFSSITYSLPGNVENLTLTGVANINAKGNSSSNALTGNNGNNTLTGQAGNDVIKGGAGSDRLSGNDGADHLDGGKGVDHIAGGAGKDTFIFSTPLSAANRDIITDFNHTADTFGLENSAMSALGPTGALKSAYFFAGTSAHDHDDHIIYDKGTGALYYDSNGIDAGGVTQLATLTNKPTLQANDFVVI